ncbi:MAG: four helix bundle protein [Patescibacteria group bacterium]
MSKLFDLEERTFQFAKDVVFFCNGLRKNIATQEHIHQLIRSSGSVGANYIEANEALSKKDFLMRIKISRKEAKETCYWLRLIIESNSGIDEKGNTLLDEAMQLKKILSSILEKSLKSAIIKV